MGHARRSAIGLVDAGMVTLVRGNSMSESSRGRDRSALRNLDADRRGAVLDHPLARHPELREALEPFLKEIRRRACAGLHDEAATYADGVAEGLALLAQPAF